MPVLTVDIFHRCTSDKGIALKHQYWGLGAPVIRLVYEGFADLHIHAFLRFDTDLLGLIGTLPKVAFFSPLTMAPTGQRALPQFEHKKRAALLRPCCRGSAGVTELSKPAVHPNLLLNGQFRCPCLPNNFVSHLKEAQLESSSFYALCTRYTGQTCLYKHHIKSR